MALAFHRLRRLQLAWQTPDQSVGTAVLGLCQAGLSSRLAAVVAQVCEELWNEARLGEASFGPALRSAEAVLRVKRLELKLGTFELERLEADVPEALERALREALRHALADALHNPSPETRWLSPAAARLERIASFLERGVWPFQTSRPGAQGATAPGVINTDADDNDVREALDPAQQLTLLLRDDPEGLLTLLRRLVSQRASLERLVLQLDAGRFGELLALVATADAPLILTYLVEIQQLHQLQPLLPVAPEQLTHSLRVLTLSLLLCGPGSPFNRRVFFEQLLRQLSLEYHLSYAELLDKVRMAQSASLRLQPTSESLLVPQVELLNQEMLAAGSLVTALAAALAAAQGVGTDGVVPEPGDAGMGDGGDLGPLLALLRGHPDPTAVQRALAPQLDGELFGRLLRALAPQEAPLVMAYLDDVVAVQRQQPLLPLALVPFEKQLRSIALQLMLHPATSAFARRVFLERLLRELAQSQQLAYPLLLRSLAASLARLPQPINLRSALPGLVGELINSEFGNAVVDSGQPGQGRPVKIQPVPAPASSHFSPTAPKADARSALAIPLEQWQAFLRDGSPAQLGPRLHNAVLADPEGFVALLRQLLAAAALTNDAASAGWLERLLRWLLPESLALLMATAAGDPHPSAQAFALWAERLADQRGGQLSGAWRELLPALLAPEAQTPSAADLALAPLASRHLDQRAALGHWLRYGVLPSWLAAGAPWPAPQGRAIQRSDMETLVTGLAEAPEFDLLRLLLPLAEAGGAEALREALQRLGQHVPAASFTRLLERLLPWLRQPTGVLAEALSAAPPKQWPALRLRAVALALSGAPCSVATLLEPLPPLPEQSPEPDTPPHRPVVAQDPQQLLAWLRGEGPETPEQLPTLFRLMAQMADQANPELLALLREGVSDAASRQRWSQRLPEALLSRIVLLLQPGRGRLLVDLRAWLAVVASQVSPIRGNRPGALSWDLLLSLLAETDPLPSRAIAQRLLAHHSQGGSAAEAVRLCRHARQLASESDALHLLASLEADLSPPPPPRPALPPLRFRDHRQPHQPEPVYLANAGLVLFHPFLPQLFDRLQLLSTATDGTVRVEGLEARSRAVHLLQWLVDGRLDRPEAELGLNKLLAGLDLAQPIRSSHIAREEDLAIATGMLEAVIRHWPPLANTSIAGLRETFLQREGRLDPPSHDLNQWTLHVERRTVDVLFQKLPWSITLVKHPWMPLPLHVQW